MKKLRYHPFPRLLSFPFVVFFCAYILLNPELFLIFLHEHTFHKIGSEIKHVHADNSLHTFFKHNSLKTEFTSLEIKKKLLIITLFVFNARFEFVKASWCGFILLLLFFLLRRAQKHSTSFPLTRFARAPPLR
jgi:hypothetical protein